MPEDAKFCTQCGQPAKETDSCPKCGTKLSPSDKFCPGCGTRISEDKFHTHKKANIISKSKKKIILISLGCVLVIALLGAGVFFGYKALNGSDSKSNDGWVEIGHVSFANEYGITDPSTDLDFRFKIGYYNAQQLSGDVNVKLYKKSAAGTNIYEIRTGNGHNWPVERGAFVTEAGELYNARVLYVCEKPEYNSYCYFNIDD